MTQYIFEIDGDLQTDNICESLKQAQSNATSAIEDSGSTEASVIIYELKPLQEGSVSLKTSWLPYGSSK